MSSWMLFFSVIAFIQLVNKILLIEENKDVVPFKNSYLERHWGIIFIYFFLFFGMVLGFSFWFAVLPEPLVQTLFSDQLSEIIRIQGVRNTISETMVSGQMSQGVVMNALLDSPEANIQIFNVILGISGYPLNYLIPYGCFSLLF